MFSAVKIATSNLYFKDAWMVHHHLLEATQCSYEFLMDMEIGCLGSLTSTGPSITYIYHVLSFLILNARLNLLSIVSVNCLPGMMHRTGG